MNNLEFESGEEKEIELDYFYRENSILNRSLCDETMESLPGINNSPSSLQDRLYDLGIVLTGPSLAELHAKCPNSADAAVLYYFDNCSHFDRIDDCKDTPKATSIAISGDQDDWERKGLSSWGSRTTTIFNARRQKNDAYYSVPTDEDVIATIMVGKNEEMTTIIDKNLSVAALKEILKITTASLLSFDLCSIQVQQAARHNRARFLLMAETQKLVFKYAQLTKKVQFSFDMMASLRARDAESSSDDPALVELIQYGYIKCNPLQHGNLLLATINDVKQLHSCMPSYTPDDSPLQKVVDELEKNSNTPGVASLCGLYMLSVSARKSLAVLVSRIETVFPDTHCSVGPLKLPGRSLEKSRMDYEGDPTRLLDLVRASVVCRSVQMMNDLVERLSELYPGIIVVRVKNGFSSRHAVGTYGYRDIKLNIWIPVQDENGADLNKGLIGELQLHLRDFYELKTQLGHRLYSWIRRFDIYGMTSADILLTFDAAVAEATVSLCAANAIRFLDDAAIENSTWVERSGQNNSENAVMKEIFLADDITAYPLVLEVQGIVADEKLARELEVFCCFQHYRLVHQTSAVYRFESKSKFDLEAIEDLNRIEAFVKQKIVSMDDMRIFSDVEPETIFPNHEITAKEVKENVENYFQDPITVALYLEYLLGKISSFERRADERVFAEEFFLYDLADTCFATLEEIYTNESPRFMAAYLSFYSERILADAEKTLYRIAALFHGNFSGKVTISRLLKDRERCLEHKSLDDGGLPYFVMCGLWPLTTAGILFGLQFETVSTDRNVVVVSVLLLVAVAPFLQLLVLEKRKRRCLVICYRLRRVLLSSGGSGHKLWFHSTIENTVWMQFVFIGAFNIAVGFTCLALPRRGDVGASDQSVRVCFMSLHFLYLWIVTAIFFVPRTRVIDPSASAQRIWHLAYFVFALFMGLQLVLIVMVYLLSPLAAICSNVFEVAVMFLFTTRGCQYLVSALSMTYRGNWCYSECQEEAYDNISDFARELVLVFGFGLSLPFEMYSASNKALQIQFVFCAFSNAGLERMKKVYGRSNLVLQFLVVCFLVLWCRFAVPEILKLMGIWSSESEHLPSILFYKPWAKVDWLPNGDCTYSTSDITTSHHIDIPKITCVYWIKFSMSSSPPVFRSDPVSYLSQRRNSVVMPVCPGDDIFVNTCPSFHQASNTASTSGLSSVCHGSPVARLFDDYERNRPNNTTNGPPLFSAVNGSVLCTYNSSCPIFGYTLPGTIPSGDQSPWKSKDSFTRAGCRLVELEGGCRENSGNCSADFVVDVTLKSIPHTNSFTVKPLIAMASVYLFIVIVIAVIWKCVVMMKLSPVAKAGFYFLGLPLIGLLILMLISFILYLSV